MSVSPEPHAEPFSTQKAAPRSSSQSHQSGSQYRRIVTMGAKQRQLLFDLERHPFESSTMTQLFHILSKRSTQWWRVQEQRREREQREEEEEAQQQQQQQGLDQTVGGASSALDSTVGPADTSRTSASPSHAKDVLSMLHGDRAASGRVRTALRHRTKQRGPNKPAGNQTASTIEHDNDEEEDEDGLQLEIPDTIVWENNIPKGWYYFDPKEKHVSRRKVETKQVQEALLRDAAFENDIVAVHYVMEGPASSSSGGGGSSSGGGHHHHHDSSTGSDGVLGFRYLTAAELPIFLFENRRGKGTSILQKFVYSLGAQHNDCIQVTWSPSVVHVHRRQNVNDMFDERIAPNTRCAIFEGRTHQSREMQCTPKLKERIGLLCKRLVSHFHETDAKHKISRLVLHVKISDASKLMILYCSSARVQKYQQAGQSGEPGSLSLELHQKFRVSVELATQYVTKELEGSAGGHTAGEHEALLAAQQDADHREGVLRRRLSMVAKSAEMTHVSVTNRQKKQRRRRRKSEQRQQREPSSSPGRASGRTQCGPSRFSYANRVACSATQKRKLSAPCPLISVPHSFPDPSSPWLYSRLHAPLQQHCRWTVSRGLLADHCAGGLPCREPTGLDGHPPRPWSPPPGCAEGGPRCGSHGTVAISSGRRAHRIRTDGVTVSSDRRSGQAPEEQSTPPRVVCFWRHCGYHKPSQLSQDRKFRRSARQTQCGVRRCAARHAG